MVGSVSDTISNYKECIQEALKSQLDATSTAYEMIMTKDYIAASQRWWDWTLQDPDIACHQKQNECWFTWIHSDLGLAFPCQWMIHIHQAGPAQVQ
jgi:hypothetical protein